ncbi:MAG: hypothetical protein FWH48_02050, partial [Oscillospiraceae bacterium]|nr:hypothetical protein [Oscillospiraceae bacterium]
MNTIKKTKKIISGLSIALAMALILAVMSALTVSAADTVVKNTKAQIDFTDSNATGTVKINVVAKTDKKVKIAVEKG